MYIKNTYIGTVDGYGAIWCGFDPREKNPEAIVKEIRPILNAEKGYNLIRIADEENVGSSIWLKDDDIQENYREEKQEESSEE